MAWITPLDTEPNGPNANATPVSAPTTMERVTTRPNRYPDANVVANESSSAMLSWPIGDTPSHRNGSIGIAMPSNESE